MGVQGENKEELRHKKNPANPKAQGKYGAFFAIMKLRDAFYVVLATSKEKPIQSDSHFFTNANEDIFLTIPNACQCRKLS